ncbi:MAG: hypothetical protein P8183_08850 [Anaerolineae bacterium]|jgi:hypothetical protein
MMNQDCDFYICPTCFRVSEEPATCHDHMMIHCRDLQPGDPRLKPLIDEEGTLKNSAPRWFIEKVKTMK